MIRFLITPFNQAITKPLSIVRLKRFLAGTLTLTLQLAMLSSHNLALVYAEQVPLQGSVVQSDKLVSPHVNFEDVRKIEAGTDLHMTVTTALTPAVSVEGDEFFARITQNYEAGGKTLIPKGSLVHGVIQEAKGPGHAGKNSYINANFDYIITPDGREVPIEGAFSSKDKPLKAAAKVVGRATGYTAVGGVVGALMVLRYGGMAAVAATNGYALAGGAALGGAAGLVGALVGKGEYKMLQPGAELKIKLQEPLALPTVDMPDESDQNFVAEGLKVDVLGTQLGKDPFGEMTELTLALDMINRTDNTFTFFDIALQDEYGATFYPSAFGDTSLWFRKFEPNSKLTGNLSFCVDNPTAQHYLVFFKRYTREPMARIALTSEMTKDKKVAKKMLQSASNKHYTTSGLEN